MVLGADEVIVGDLMLCEVLLGLDERAAQEVEALLRRFDTVPMAGDAIAVEAARNFRSLRRRGITVRKTIDLLIGTWCIENRRPLLHNDSLICLWPTDSRLRKPDPRGRGGCKIKEAAKRRPPVAWSSSELPRHPPAATPVAAAFMFTERVPFVPSPMPIVFVNDDTRFVREVILVMNMPADVALAYNSRGCAEGGHHHDTCTDYGSGKKFLKHLHFISMSPLPRVVRYPTRVTFE
jgi:hypothetical protein